jgi:hypothetical protein
MKKNIQILSALILISISVCSYAQSGDIVQAGPMGTIGINIGSAIAKNEAMFATGGLDSSPGYQLANAYRDRIGIAFVSASGTDPNYVLCDLLGAGVSSPNYVQGQVVSQADAQSIATSLGVTLASITASRSTTSSSTVTLNINNKISWQTSVDTDGALKISYTLTVSSNGTISSKTGSFKLPQLDTAYLAKVKAEYLRQLGSGTSSYYFSGYSAVYTYLYSSIPGFDVGSMWTALSTVAGVSCGQLQFIGYGP